MSIGRAVITVPSGVGLEHTVPSLAPLREVILVHQSNHIIVTQAGNLGSS